MVNTNIQTFFNVGGKRLTISQFLALRQRISKLRGSKNPNVDLRRNLNTAYAKFSEVVDFVIAEQVGGIILKSRGGTGFRADILEVDQDGNPVISEVKSINTLINEQGQVTSASAIDLGQITVANITEIATGSVGATATGAEQQTVPFAVSGKVQQNFFQALQKRNRRDRIIYLNSLRNKNTPYGRAAKQIIENIETKSFKIYVSTPTASGSSEIREIGWSWKDIVKNKKIVLSTKGDKGFTVEIPSDEVIKALNSSKIKRQYTALNSEALERINRLLVESQFSDATFKSLEKLNIDFKTATTYDSGSVNIYKTSFKTKNIIEKAQKGISTSGQFISKIQLTALVQRAMLQRMPRGPERGPPLSPRILTHRTGQFLRSTQISLLNYKTNVIQYFYDPIYRVHENTKRDPRELIEASIREVTQRQFGRQFNIIRA